jgi:Yip1 domain
MTMTSTELAQDGTVVLRTLADPVRGLAEAVGRRRVATVLGVSTLALLVFTAVVTPRIDYEAQAAAELSRGPGAADVTQHQREAAAATARKLGYVGNATLALLTPSVGAALAAAFLWLGFRVAGTRPGYKETFAAMAHGQLPAFLAPLLSIPAVLSRGLVGADDAKRLLPSSLAALFPSAPPPLAAALGAADLFTLWAVVLVALGMSRASGASRRRAFTVTIVLFLAYVALVQVVPAALFAVGPGPRGGP